MNLLRLLFIILAVWIAVFLIRRYLKRTIAPRKAAPRIGNMVRCQQCGLHVLEAEALENDGRYYCSTQHRDELSEHR